MKRAINLGAWFSVGPAMLESVKGRDLVKAMPPEKILTESDGPFARRGNKPISPNDVGDAEMKIADLWNIGRTETSELPHSNFKTLLNMVSK